MENLALTNAELTGLVAAYMLNPSTTQRSSEERQEGLLGVLEWAEKLKTRMMIYGELLTNIREGVFNVDYRDGEVFLSMAPNIDRKMPAPLAEALLEIIPGIQLDPNVIEDVQDD